MIEINEKLATEIKNAAESIYNLSKYIGRKNIYNNELTQLESKEAIQYMTQYDQFNCPQKYYYTQFGKWTIQIRKNRRKKQYSVECKNFKIKNIWNQEELKARGKIEEKNYGGNIIINIWNENLEECKKIFWVCCRELEEQTSKVKHLWNQEDKNESL